MARPLRIAIEDGWYHVINREIERRSIFRAIQLGSRLKFEACVWIDGWL